MSVIKFLPGENALARRDEFTDLHHLEEVSSMPELESIEDLYGRARSLATNDEGELDSSMVLGSVFTTVRGVDVSPYDTESAYVTASILSMFKEEGAIRGSAAVHEFKDAYNEGSFVKYTASNGRQVILDIDRGFRGTIPVDEVHPVFWRYLDIEQKRSIVSEQSRRLLDGEVQLGEELGSIDRNDVDFVTRVIVDKV